MWHSPGLKKIYVKGERAPGEYWAASITMVTPLHHNLKLYEDTPRIGRTLFWVTTPLRHILPSVSEGGVGGVGGRNSGLTSRQLVSQLFITYFPQRSYLYLNDVFSMVHCNPASFLKSQCESYLIHKSIPVTLYTIHLKKTQQIPIRINKFLIWNFAMLFLVCLRMIFMHTYIFHICIS